MSLHPVRPVNPALSLTINWWRVEWLCLLQSFRSVRRHRRYGGVVLLLYGKSLVKWQPMRVHRIGFAALQGLDDLLDGDRPCICEPLDVAAKVRHAVIELAFDNSEWGILFGALSVTLVSSCQNSEALTILVALIDDMMSDRKRVKERLLLSREDLFKHLRSTFVHSLDLSLIATGSKFRAHDMSDLVEMLSWCSVVRDLHEDWEKGLINVPIEVLRQVGWPEQQDPTLITAPAVSAWLHQEYNAVEQNFVAFRRVESMFLDCKYDPGIAMLSLYANALHRYRKSYYLSKSNAY